MSALVFQQPKKMIVCLTSLIYVVKSSNHPSIVCYLEAIEGLGEIYFCHGKTLRQNSFKVGHQLPIAWLKRVVAGCIN